MKSIKIFNNTSVSDFLLPGKIDIIFLSLGIIFSIILLFDFEKKYFDKENIPKTFEGHPY